MKKPYTQKQKERVAQITNDIAEDCCTAGKKDLMLCVNYWRDRCDAWNNLHQRRMLEMLNILNNHVGEPYPAE